MLIPTGCGGWPTHRWSRTEVLGAMEGLDTGTEDCMRNETYKMAWIGRGNGNILGIWAWSTELSMLEFLVHISIV